MAPATGTALLLLAVFILPGFVTLLLKEWAYAFRGPDSPLDRLLHSLFFSLVAYGVVLFVAVGFGLDKNDLRDFYLGRKSLSESLAAGFLIGIVAPAGLALAGLGWHRSRLRSAVLEKLQIEPDRNADSGWNQAMSRPGTPLVRATLSDGRVIGGRYDEGSLAGYSQREQDLFLSQRWTLDEDDWFLAPAPATRGVWIRRDAIVTLEFSDENWDDVRTDPDVPIA